MSLKSSLLVAFLSFFVSFAALSCPLEKSNSSNHSIQDSKMIVQSEKGLDSKNVVAAKESCGCKGNMHKGGCPLEKGPCDCGEGCDCSKGEKCSDPKCAMNFEKECKCKKDSCKKKKA